MNKNLKEKINDDKKTYRISKNPLKDALFSFSGRKVKIIQKIIIAARKYAYYKSEIQKSPRLLKKLIFSYHASKYHRLAAKYNMEIACINMGKNVKFCHFGNIINWHSIIGDDCKFHGHNCVGNNGVTLKAPRLGRNVDIGVGAVIIGDIFIADNIVIGANAVVNKSFYEEGVVIAGCPARIIARKKSIVSETNSLNDDD